jgi:hypothetical protein
MMRTMRRSTLLSLCLVLASAGCTTYSSVTRDGSGVYLAGTTNFLIFGHSWIKRCAESRSQTGPALACEDVLVRDLGAGESRASAAVAEEVIAPRTDKDCEQSCARYGACTARNGRCVATSSVDCRRSTACTEQGWCVERDGRCFRDDEAKPPPEKTGRDIFTPK